MLKTQEIIEQRGNGVNIWVLKDDEAFGNPFEDFAHNFSARV